MLILTKLIDSAKTANKPCLVIGGLAVAAHGYPRLTGDIDLLIPKNDAEYWISAVASLGYKQSQRNDVFLRFVLTNDTSWPIDLMLVSDSIFQEMAATAIKSEINGTEIKIPSKKHMIALKLHALKSRQEHRELRDTLDISKFLEMGAVNCEEFRLLCTKYDRIDLYETLKKYIK